MEGSALHELDVELRMISDTVSMLRRRAELHPDRTAILDFYREENSLTYAELDLASDVRSGCLLQTAREAPEIPVGMSRGRYIDACIDYFAVQKAGAIPVIDDAHDEGAPSPENWGAIGKSSLILGKTRRLPSPVAHILANDRGRTSVAQADITSQYNGIDFSRPYVIPNWRCWANDLGTLSLTSTVTLMNWQLWQGRTQMVVDGIETALNDPRTRAIFLTDDSLSSVTCSYPAVQCVVVYLPFFHRHLRNVFPSAFFVPVPLEPTLGDI